MTSMKGEPLSAFNASVRGVLVNSLKEACQALGVQVVDGSPVVRRSTGIHGDYLAGIRVSGKQFQGLVTLSMDKRMAKAFADKIFAGTNAKTDDSMLCDLVGEVCNQTTGVIQRGLGKMGCKMQVTAQETVQSPSTLEVAPSPEEWFLIPFKFNESVGVLGFGVVGDLGLGTEDNQEELTDTRKITFF